MSYDLGAYITSSDALNAVLFNTEYQKFRVIIKTIVKDFMKIIKTLIAFIAA